MSFFHFLAIFCQVKFRKVMSRLFPLQSIFCNPRPELPPMDKTNISESDRCPALTQLSLWSNTMWFYPNYLCEAIQCGFIPIISVKQYQWSAFYGFELFKFAKVAAWALIYREGGAVESFCFLELWNFQKVHFGDILGSQPGREWEYRCV